MLHDPPTVLPPAETSEVLQNHRCPWLLLPTLHWPGWAFERFHPSRHTGCDRQAASEQPLVGLPTNSNKHTFSPRSAFRTYLRLRRVRRCFAALPPSPATVKRDVRCVFRIIRAATFPITDWLRWRLPHCHVLHKRPRRCGDAVMFFQDCVSRIAARCWVQPTMD